MLRTVKEKCRFCGRRIVLIKGNSGKTSAYDEEMVSFVPDMNGRTKYLLPDGLVVWGEEAAEEDKDRHIGYRSHVASCPERNKMMKARRMKDKKVKE